MNKNQRLAALRRIPLHKGRTLMRDLPEHLPGSPREFQPVTPPEPGSQAEFAAFAEGLLMEDIIPKLRNKGQQYTGNEEPATANFDWIAEQHDMPPEQALMVLADKHWYTLRQWSRGLRPGLNDAADRAGDILIYMLLLLYRITLNSQKEEE